jgi:hypothetical protein
LNGLNGGFVAGLQRLGRVLYFFWVFFLGRGKEGELCSVDKKGKKDQNVCIIFVGVVKRVQTIDRQRSRRVCFNKGKRTGGVQLGGFLPLVVFA